MNTGLFYVVIAQFFWATELILIRKFFPHVNSIFLSAVGSIIGSMFYLPTLFFVKEKVSADNWIILIIYALTSWFLAQIFYVTGIQKGVSAFAIALVTLLLPVFAFIMAAIFLKEPLNLKIIIGATFMIIGFLIISL